MKCRHCNKDLKGIVVAFAGGLYCNTKHTALSLILDGMTVGDAYRKVEAESEHINIEELRGK